MDRHYLEKFGAVKMARAKKKSDKKPIEQYDHKGKEGLNNPSVGLVTPETDKKTGKKTYAYDPHLDPSLQWAGKAEHTSFEVPTVSLHVHERIDPEVRLKKVTSVIASKTKQSKKQGIASPSARNDDSKQYQVEVLGFDYYNTKTGNIKSGGTDRIAMWRLDTDYDGRSLFPGQVFFPMAGEKDGWSRLAKNLKAVIDEELIEAYRGNVSLPFEIGDNRRIAVKIVDDRGIESLKILEVE